MNSTPRPHRRPLAEAAREAIENDPVAAAAADDAVALGEVRVLCPRGHFIANVAVIRLNGTLTLLRPRGKDREHFGDVFDDPNHGFRFDDRARRLRVRLQCQREKCPYDGSFDYQALGSELQDAAAAGHREHRMTS